VNHLPSDDYLELQRVQRELAATRGKISELEELINEVPEIYERKFDQKLQPLVEDVRLLSERNQALREQLRHALSPAAADAAPPLATPAVPDAEAAANGPAAPAQSIEQAAPPPPPSQPQRQRSGKRPASRLAWPRRWRWPQLAWPNLRWPQQTQPPRPLRLALLAAAGVGVVGGLALQQWRVYSSGDRSAGSRAAGGADSASAGRDAQSGLILELRSPSETWLDVRNLRGAPLYSGLFSGERRFPIGQGLRLNAGKPELVRIRIGDGPERGLGHPGWWVWHSFGPDGRQGIKP